MRTIFATVCFAILPLSKLPQAEADQSQTKPQAAAEQHLSPKELQKRYSKTVLDQVQADVKSKGAFVVHDDVLNKDWHLTMVKVHTDRIWDMKNGRFFACADLKEVAGPKTKVDLDFYVSQHGDQWVMDKVIVHKVSGKPRYNYVEDGGKWFMEAADSKKRTPVD